MPGKASDVTTREIALKVGVTERAIQKLILNLEGERYITWRRNGRSNRYTINTALPMRHRMEREFSVGNLLMALGSDL